jgi:hypothetical protein
MTSHSAESTVNALETQKLGTCHFLKLPLELRDIIYGMLLTTRYCTQLNAVGELPWLKFYFHTAIILVNKQVSAEAVRILYKGNHFIILQTIGMSSWYQHTTPVFKLLSEPNVKSPVLRIDLTAVSDASLSRGPVYTYITTQDGLLSIISDLWQWEHADRRNPRDLRLTLDFSPNAESSYQFLSELVLRPWDKISGVKDLVLTGPIKEPMRNHLEKYNLEGPSSIDIDAHLKKYHSLAEREFEQEDYDAAGWWWSIFNRYWIYVSNLRPYRVAGGKWSKDSDGVWDVLRKSHSMYYEGILKLMKAFLRQSKYIEALQCANKALFGDGIEDWDFERFGDRMTAIMKTKFHLSGSLARTALRNTNSGMCDIKLAARTLHSNGPRSLNMDMSLRQLTEDLKLTVNNELIRLESLHRCGSPWPLFPPRRKGRKPRDPDWQFSVVRQSFWEWLELPEELEVAEEREVG